MMIPTMDASAWLREREIAGWATNLLRSENDQNTFETRKTVSATPDQGIWGFLPPPTTRAC
jgi:hypothetical protein